MKKNLLVAFLWAAFAVFFAGCESSVPSLVSENEAKSNAEMVAQQALASNLSQELRKEGHRELATLWVKEKKVLSVEFKLEPAKRRPDYKHSRVTDQKMKVKARVQYTYKGRTRTGTYENDNILYWQEEGGCRHMEQRGDHIFKWDN